MNAENILVDIYGPIILAGFFTTMGWIVRDVRTSRRFNKQQFEHVLNNIRDLMHRDDDIARQQQNNTIAIDRINREFAPVKEAVAVLSSELERHERWHERH